MRCVPPFEGVLYYDLVERCGSHLSCDIQQHPGGQAPDDVTLPIPDRHLHPASGPGVVLGGADARIGKILLYAGKKIVGVYLRRCGLKEREGNGKDLGDL